MIATSEPASPGAVLYHRGSRRLQDAYDTRRLADRLEHLKVRSTIDAGDREFIASMDMFFLATADERGRPNCSYKGGDPGFVRVLDERTIAFPAYDGNGMFLSAGNVLVNPEVGLLFVSFEHQRRLRLNGSASINPDDELAAADPSALFVVRVRVREVFPNCPRYIHHYQLVERSRFVPRGDAPPPVPDWKRQDWATTCSRQATRPIGTRPRKIPAIRHRSLIQPANAKPPVLTRHAASDVAAPPGRIRPVPEPQCARAAAIEATPVIPETRRPRQDGAAEPADRVPRRRTGRAPGDIRGRSAQLSTAGTSARPARVVRMLGQHSPLWIAVRLSGTQRGSHVAIRQGRRRWGPSQELLHTPLISAKSSVTMRRE